MSKKYVATHSITGELLLDKSGNICESESTEEILSIAIADGGNWTVIDWKSDVIIYETENGKVTYSISAD